MAFGSFNPQSNQVPQSEINMVPLIDVMLVLLVIFMVTAPLLTHAVKVDLPGAKAQPALQAEKIEVSINGEGQLFWNATPISQPELVARLQKTGMRAPETEIHLRVDRHTRYETIAEIMAAAAAAGLGKIGFVTLPAESAD
jgi:biopolymer transport protein ExbD